MSEVDLPIIEWIPNFPNDLFRYEIILFLATYHRLRLRQVSRYWATHLPATIQFLDLVYNSVFTDTTLSYFTNLTSLGLRDNPTITDAAVSFLTNLSRNL